MRSELNFRMIRLAREYRGATQTDLTRQGVASQARLSRFEAGEAAPSDPELEKLAEALQMPVDFFFEPDTPAAAPLFRKRAIRSAKKLSGIQARLNTAVLVAKRLMDAGVEIDPPYRFPDAGDYPADEPELAAQRLRRDWRLPSGRVDSITEIIESAGGMVVRVDFGSDDASAALLSMPGEGRDWFLVNTREDSGDRVRLSLAHELGHAVLHRRLPSADEAQTEDQAFLFAATLLLPPDSFNALVPQNALTLSIARRIKATFGVSIQAIIRASYQRGLINRDRYTSLFKQLSARQWRTREPDPVSIEVPEVWPGVLAVHRQEHRYTNAELASIARVNEDTLAELFPEEFATRPRLRSVPVSTLRSASFAQ